MNEAIRELRCAMNLADGVGDKMDDLYMYGVAAGIRFALEHLDEGSTTIPDTTVHKIKLMDVPFSDEAAAATREAANDTELEDMFDRYAAFLAHGY